MSDPWKIQPLATFYTILVKIRSKPKQGNKKMAKKAIVLVNGGLHSTAALAIAASRNYEIYALTIDYGNKNRTKLEAAKKMAQKYGATEHKIIKIDMSDLLGGNHPGVAEGNPVLPARNGLFMSFALSYAELVQAANIYIGINSIEYGDNPDCRPAFIHSFEKYAEVAIKKTAMRKIDIWSPLMNARTSETILRGAELNIDWADTISCQTPDEEGRACGECMSCEIRREAFEEAGIADPTRYQK